MITDARKAELRDYASDHTTHETVTRLERKFGPVIRAMQKGRAHCEKRYPGRVDWNTEQNQSDDYTGPRTDEEQAFVDSLSKRMMETRIDKLAPLATEATAQKARCRKAQKKATAKRSEHKKQVHEFIREQWRMLSPSITAGSMLIKEAYAEIQSRVSRKFNAFGSDVDPLEISWSRIDRALGKKK